MSISPGLRSQSNCGDYEQTTGVLVIPKGVSSGGFTVNIVDDQCYERFMEFIQVAHCNETYGTTRCLYTFFFAGNDFRAWS